MPGVAATLFEDEEFPPCNTSLGQLDLLDDGYMSYNDIVWVRVKDALGCDWDEKKPQLFEDGVAASDIHQGYLGDCWLLGGLACIAQKNPELISSRFTSPRDEETGEPIFSKTGRYVIQLYDDEAECWTDVVIDDLIPCTQTAKGYKPLFAKPEGREAWVLLMEKAVAKHFGAYWRIEGGRADWVFKAIAGNRADDYVSYMLNGPDNWIAAKTVTRTEGRCYNRILRTQEYLLHPESSGSLTKVDIFKKLRKWVQDSDNDYIIASGSMGESDRDETDGILGCHAYALLDVVAVPGFTMIKLANPHGTGSTEWKGTWSNRDLKSWKEHPEVAEACGWTGTMAGTGMFWMQDMDYECRFRSIYVARLPKNPLVRKEIESLDSGEWEVDPAAEADVAADGGEPIEPVEACDDDEEECESPEQFQTRVFCTYDEDNSGTLCPAELPGALATIADFPLTPKLIKQLQQAVGLPPKGQVSLFMFQKMARLLDKVQAFCSYDKDNSGTLTVPEVQVIAKQLLNNEGPQNIWTKRAARLAGYMTGSRNAEIQEKVDTIMARYDTDGDGELDMVEFLRFWNEL